MRFAAFIKEKRRELRRLGRLIFSKCLNRFWGLKGERSGSEPLRCGSWRLGARSRGLQGFFPFFFFLFSLLPHLLVFPHSKAALPLRYPKPAGCLISCAPPRPFQWEGLLLCRIQAAVSASSYFTANTEGFLFFFFVFFIPPRTKRRARCR